MASPYRLRFSALKALSRQRLKLPQQVLRDRGEFRAAVLLPVEQPKLGGGVVLVEELGAGEAARPAGEALELRDRGQCLALRGEPLGQTRRSVFAQEPAGPESRRQ